MTVKRVLAFVVLCSMCMTFNVFAMPKNTYDYIPETPYNEEKHEDRNLNQRWTWINDDMCVQFGGAENGTRSSIQRMADMVLLRRWAESDGEGGRKLKTRDTYAGKWSQDAAGIWSFVFDDYTIPVGVTKIDGVLYAFNTFGELKEGYKYYGDLTTGADGLVVTDNEELNKWLETEYLPECSSHE